MTPDWLARHSHAACPGCVEDATEGARLAGENEDLKIEVKRLSLCADGFRSDRGKAVQEVARLAGELEAAVLLARILFKFGVNRVIPNWLDILGDDSDEIAEKALAEAAKGDKA